MREEVKKWFEQAQEDFITAKVLFEKKRYYAAVIFSQQSAEKAIHHLKEAEVILEWSEKKIQL